MHLSRFPRVSLAHLPTPLEHLPRLSAELGGPQVWVKRDDCTGLATGGNKTRKLEFSLAAAIEEGADTIDGRRVAIKPCQADRGSNLQARPVL